MNKFRKITVLLLILVFIFAFAGCSNEDKSEIKESENSILINDDMGNEVLLNGPAKKIISLYSAHTENLYELGLDEEIIGVGTSDIYPVDVLNKETYSYKDDVEKILGASPDLILTRPFINRNYPEFVEALENAGITVISLYCDSYEKFDDYINTLGKITGKEEVAKEKLLNFHKKIDNIFEKTKGIENKVNVYFEATEKEYRTVTTNSMAANAIKFAGGVNIASDALPIKEGSSIASYGEEKLLSKANEIDVYISQRGAMNAGGNYHSIVIRPGFDTIKAVKNNEIYIVNQKLISSATFRFYKGVKQLSRLFYPEIFGDLEEFRSDEIITRRDLAKLIVMKKKKTFYVPSSKYYRSEHENHTHGFFQDVNYKDEDYDYIETAVMASYMEGAKKDSLEYFYPEEEISRDEFAKIVFKMSDFKIQSEHLEVIDLDECINAKIVQILVDNSTLTLENGKFMPDSPITYSEAIDAFNKF